MDTLQNAFLSKYPNTRHLPQKWQDATACPFTWESLNKPNFAKFTAYLCDNLAQSSARQYCARLKAVVELYSDHITLPRDWRKALSVKNDESQQVYLTEDEIQRIIDYRPDTLTEATVQQQFVLGCLTGARHSDYTGFTTANVTDDGNLVYVSRKTHIKVEIPLADVARNILFSQKGARFPQAYQKQVCDTTFNTTIRQICDLCDIDDDTKLYRNGSFWQGKKWQAVSSHTARRSFATNLYLRCRDLYLVSQLCGHSSTTMTERYICCATENYTQEALAYFTSFR